MGVSIRKEVLGLCLKYRFRDQMVTVFKRSLIFLGVFCVLGAGCGQSGPLYLPEAAQDPVVSQGELDGNEQKKDGAKSRNY